MVFGGQCLFWLRVAGKQSYPQCDWAFRLMAIEISNGNKNVLVLNVYIPFDSSDNFDESIFYLSKINDIIEERSSSYDLALGDYNANIRTDDYGHVTKRFRTELLNVCIEEVLHIIDKIHLVGNDNFTFISDLHNTLSWLDHSIGTNLCC